MRAYSRGIRLFTGITIEVPCKNVANAESTTDSTFCDDDVSILSGSDEYGGLHDKDDLLQKHIQKQKIKEQKPIGFTTKLLPKTTGIPSASVESESENQRPSGRRNAWNDLVSQWEMLHSPRKSESVANKRASTGSTDPSPKSKTQLRCNTRPTSISTRNSRQKSSPLPPRGLTSSLCRSASGAISERASKFSTISSATVSTNSSPIPLQGLPSSLSRSASGATSERASKFSSRSSTTVSTNQGVVATPSGSRRQHVASPSSTPKQRINLFTKNDATPSSAPAKQQVGSPAKRTAPRIPVSPSSRKIIPPSSDKWTVMSAGFSCVMVQTVSFSEKENETKDSNNEKQEPKPQVSRVAASVFPEKKQRALVLDAAKPPMLPRKSEFYKRVLSVAGHKSVTPLSASDRSLRWQDLYRLWSSMNLRRA